MTEAAPANLASSIRSVPNEGDADAADRFHGGATRWSLTDSLLLGALLLITLLWIVFRFDWHATPIEDAAMLLRYAENFANGHGIRWNIDDAPVDGATDFLYMVATGALARVAHIGVVTASRILVLGSEIVSVGLVFAAGRRILGGNRWLCAAVAAYLIAGPAIKIAEGCFGAPVFAAALLCCWCATLLYADRSHSWGYALAAALLAFLSGLIRPEGVLIAMILLAATVYRTGIARAIPLVVSFVSVFALLGGPYFLWRWHYFGAPLPNPFYVKGGGHLYPSSVVAAVKNLSQLLFPVVPLIPLGWVSPRTRRLTGSLLIALAGFTLMWGLLNNWNNHFMRFQYAIVPIVLVTVPGLLVDPKAIGLPGWASLPVIGRRAVAIAAVLATLASMEYIDTRLRFQDVAFGMQVFAQRLQPFASRGHSIAVTEAGVLPLYSQWHAIDGLGLNDAYIAHHGKGSVSDYLEQHPPDVVMVHLDATDVPRAELLVMLQGGEPIPGTPYEAFTRMGAFANRHRYTLAAAYGSWECNLHVYWVRPGIPDYDAIVSTIRDHPYVFLDNGQLAEDYRDRLPPPAACDPF
jgi:arabinofuranosyltransferase